MLAAQGLVCTRQGHPLFQPINAHLNAGELLLLRGANGSGKTTLLKTFAGFYRRFDGQLQCCAKQIGWMGDTTPAYLNLTARENLQQTAALFNSNHQIESILSQVNLTTLADHPTKTFSAGMKRRLNLANLMLQQADLWLLDEPLTHLDSENIDLLTVVLSTHLEHGGAAVLSSHQALSLPSTSLELTPCA